MKQHTWKKQFLKGPYEMYYWICAECLASGGPVRGEETEPSWKTVPSPFLSGAPIALSVDCETSKRVITDFLESNPVYREAYAKLHSLPME